MLLTSCLNDVQLGIKDCSKLSLDFLLKKLSCTADDIFLLDEEEHEVPPFAAKFCSVHGQKHILAVASEDGDVLLLDTNRKAKVSLIKQWKAHYNAIFDICWLNGEGKLITASGDRTSVLWDVINEEKITIFKGHKSSIKNIRSRPKSQCVFATASRDGSIRIWDTRCNKSYNDISCGAEMTIRDAHNAASVIPGTPKQRKKKEVYSTSGNPLNSVTSIEFQDENLLFSAGTADGIVKVWDLRRNYSVAKKEAVPYIKFPYKGNSTKAHGFTSLVFNDSHSVLYANCTDSVIYAYNSSSYSSVPQDHVLEVTKDDKTNIGTNNFHYVEVLEDGEECYEFCFQHNLTFMICQEKYETGFILNDPELLLVTCKWYADQAKIAIYHGHKTSTFFVKMVISKDNEYLLSGSSDNHAYIWKTSQPGHPLLRLTGHQAEVTAVAWSSSDITKIVTCSDDVQVIFWNIDENLSGKSENKSLGKSEVIFEAHPQQESVLKKECLFNNIEQKDLKTTIVCDHSPETHNFSSNATSCITPPDITRWFKPNIPAITGCDETIMILNLSTKQPQFSSEIDNASHGRKRTLLHLSDKTPDEERENCRLTTPKAVISPDESRVLSPKKPINDANFRNAETVRRSLNMDCATLYSFSSENISYENSNCKNNSSWKNDKECVADMTVRKNVGKNEKKCKIRKINNQRNGNKNNRPSCIKVPACSGQMQLITNYFVSTEDGESSTEYTKRC